eukprot:CAMPEP_0204534548 /NCGR_PEP_ID=MMETSP0661-20131031/13035_1 /ASSEMBLY_ACC=CAM_ASM_000606 /TAXON_ID=109239 /ORGANISM="Alexandrium margalefi, Strain AMGDE01CS-322" /LENGTH=230 /DNA_ID=CAMNT_0051541009 /DNA_START=403 /DNA_END=1092 /DNA_ORIENTATION=+
MVHSPNNFHRTSLSACLGARWRSKLYRCHPKSDELVFPVEEVDNLRGLLAAVLPNPHSVKLVEGVRSPEVGRGDLHVLEEAKGHREALRRGARYAANEPLINHGQEDDEAELHLEVRLPARGLPVAGVDIRILDLDKVIELNAETNVGNHTVHILALDLPLQLYPVVILEISRADGDVVIDQGKCEHVVSAELTRPTSHRISCSVLPAEVRGRGAPSPRDSRGGGREAVS